MSKILVDFMIEYAHFFEEMALLQKQKLDIILSNDLKAIEEDILVQQAVAKKLENYECKRVSLLATLGFVDDSLETVIAKAQSEDREILQHCMTLMDSSLKDIRYYNHKCMEILKMNLTLLNVIQKTPRTYDGSIGKQVNR